ncbi:DNA-binding transcriptional LysR family regulator [Novosphingobium sp. PhB165]|uniref:LysR family transcriptional regulator n=1 Tax=Novosphingobium sp. PhB165 TaxID=2485105 RepID=UPI00104BDB47|nr:LysR family transcriptional regulator [Novosphingobium sp. PhB165]TCM21719.1 DNA-binding transcriptional LysR family regulator [Novosphingobium sp. PhB165]
MQREHMADLIAFIAVADEGSFTRAAAKLSSSQSALSHTIRRLEARLGVRLLARTTRSVAPTEAGERLLASLRPAFQEIDQSLTTIGELRERPAGTIRLTTTEHAAHELLWPSLKPFLERYPEINVEVSVDSGLSDIVADRFDAGIRLGESVARDMIAVCIGPEMRLVPVASPEYLARHGRPVTPHDLAGHQCINLRFRTRGNLYAWEFERDGRALNVRVDGQLTFNSMPMILKAALDGSGIAIMMESFSRPYVESGALVPLLEDWCQPFPGYHLYYPSRRQSSAAFRLLVDALRYRGG